MRTACFSNPTDIIVLSSTDKLRKGMTRFNNMQAVKFLFSFLKATSSPGVGRTVLLLRQERKLEFGQRTDSTITGSQRPAYVNNESKASPVTYLLDILEMTNLIAKIE